MSWSAEVTLVSSDTETANDVYRELVDRESLGQPGAAPALMYEATGANTDEFT